MTSCTIMTIPTRLRNGKCLKTCFYFAVSVLMKMISNGKMKKNPAFGQGLSWEASSFRV